MSHQKQDSIDAKLNASNSSLSAQKQGQSKDKNIYRIDNLLRNSLDALKSENSTNSTSSK